LIIIIIININEVMILILLLMNNIDIISNDIINEIIDNDD